MMVWPQAQVCVPRSPDCAPRIQDESLWRCQPRPRKPVQSSSRKSMRSFVRSHLSPSLALGAGTKISHKQRMKESAYSLRTYSANNCFINNQQSIKQLGEIFREVLIMDSGGGNYEQNKNGESICQDF